jgi:D-glycero-D-manno-heptose 1,7-bisphosphate phosphatase
MVMRIKIRKKHMFKAVFLDRDGTLIQERHYLSDPDLVVLAPTVVAALQLLRHHRFRLIMVTNQSGIGRGIIKLRQFLAVQRRLIDMLAPHGIRFDDFYYCPHHPTEAKEPYRKFCHCRKPEPGMLLEGIRKYRIAPRHSYMIGDKRADVDAGYNAKVYPILVKTGYGNTYKGPAPGYVAETLLAAAQHIVSRDGSMP